MLVVGILSGTSVDGIDAVLAKVSQHSNSSLSLEQLSFETYPWPQKHREIVFNLFSSKEICVANVCTANFELGKLFGEAAVSIIKKSGVKYEDVSIISSHGQTVWHAVNQETNKVSSTLQIGELAVIAEITGITTVGDFRVADVAANGQGAPLTSTFDWLLLRDDHKWRAIQNIGGIANVSILPPLDDKRHIKPIAFDTGPGNVYLDWFTHKITDGKLQYDIGSKLSKQGKVNAELLYLMLQHKYFTAEPPKTTGRELFNIELGEQWLSRSIELGDTENDFLATLVELTAISIIRSIKQWSIGPIDKVIVGGGGSRNPHLMERLNYHMKDYFGEDAVVCTHETIGIDSKAKEALVFALLGYLTITGQGGNVPSCTGAKGVRVLGKVCPGKNFRKVELK